VIIVTSAEVSTGAVDFFARASRMRESIRETTAHDAEIVAAIAADRLGRGRIVEFQAQLAALVRDQNFSRFNVVDHVHGVTYVGTEGGKALPFAPREPLVAARSCATGTAPSTSSFPRSRTARFWRSST
jgi:hypothetical protein